MVVTHIDGSASDPNTIVYDWKSNIVRLQRNI